MESRSGELRHGVLVNTEVDLGRLAGFGSMTFFNHNYNYNYGAFKISMTIITTIMVSLEFQL